MKSTFTWSEFEGVITTARKERIQALLEDQRVLARELWANHRVQDEVIAELAWIMDQSPEVVRATMSQPPPEACSRSTYSAS